MPRPTKCRKVCGLPGNSRFGPLDAEAGAGRDTPADEHVYINMTVDEYETVRLIDLEGLNQEECAAQMNVARTTVQGIYMEARRKMADALVNGKILLIAGGQYRLCDGQGKGCGHGGCRRREMRCRPTP